METAEVLEVASLGVGVLSLVVGTAVTLIVYRLSRRLDFRTRMHTWDELRRIVRTFAAEMHDEGLNTDVLLLNVDRYDRDYDGGNRFTRQGFVQLGSEYIDVHHDGIALIDEIVSTWLDDRGRRVLHETSKAGGNVIRVGHVPFAWVEHIEPDGNDYKNAPLIYAHFRGRGRTPFSRYTFHETTPVPRGPLDRPYYPLVTELGIHRPSRWQGVKKLWAQWLTDLSLRRAERRYTGEFDHG